MIIQQPQTDVMFINVTLDNGMQLHISGDRITVRQPGRELPDGYAPPGEYEITLPDVLDVAQRCSARDDSSLDGGTATITVTHLH